MSPTFFWYDLETFGSDPRRTRIAQFAGQRTDAELNPIGDPLVLFCKPADDLLPSPEATLVTGITPQQAQRDGVNEAELIGRVLDELAQPGTCAVGYNSLRFDDEFVRNTLYRNFHDPYEREWRGGNSRWDLLDVMRLARAMRPQGLQWPLREDAAHGRADAAGAGNAGATGAPSFKLEHLAQANGTREGTAHEALSDVQSLIGLARKFKQAQPKLFDYALRLRDKRYAASLLDIANMTPVLHISGKYPAARHCAALVAPICRHPTIDNRVIVIDLDADIDALLQLDAEGIADRLYTPTADLPEGEARVPLKEIHLNRCPVLIALEHLREDDLERLQLDLPRALAHADALRNAPGLAETVRQVYARSRERAPSDVDAALYDGFLPDADRRLFAQIRAASPQALPGFAARLTDPRMPELLFRYQARNWPGSLTSAQQALWDDYRRRRLGSDIGLSEYSFETHREAIARLRIARPQPRDQVLLDALQAWGEHLEASL
jgi:exodeoxyribonuclease-1